MHNAHVNNCLTIQARELKFCVCYLREKSASLTNFQPKWTTTSKVSDFGHFICRVSSPIGGGGQALVIKTTRIFNWILPLLKPLKFYTNVVFKFIAFSISWKGYQLAESLKNFKQLWESWKNRPLVYVLDLTKYVWYLDIYEQKKLFFLQCFWCTIWSWNSFHKHDTSNLIKVIIHVEKTFKAMPSQMCKEYLNNNVSLTEHLK